MRAVERGLAEAARHEGTLSAELHQHQDETTTLEAELWLHIENISARAGEIAAENLSLQQLNVRVAEEAASAPTTGFAVHRRWRGELQATSSFAELVRSQEELRKRMYLHNLFGKATLREDLACRSADAASRLQSAIQVMHKNLGDEVFTEREP